MANSAVSSKITFFRKLVYRRQRRVCGPQVGTRHGRCDTRVRCNVWTAACGLLWYRDRSTLLRRSRRSPATDVRPSFVRTTIDGGRRRVDRRRPVNDLRTYCTHRLGTLDHSCSPAARSPGPRTTGDRYTTKRVTFEFPLAGMLKKRNTAKLLSVCGYVLRIARLSFVLGTRQCDDTCFRNTAPSLKVV